MRNRLDRLLPGGVPRYVCLYDDGGVTAERYTAVFTGLLAGRRAGEYPYLTAGDGSDESRSGIMRRGRPTRERLKREISFQDLPDGCRKAVLEEYVKLWNL